MPQLTPQPICGFHACQQIHQPFDGVCRRTQKYPRRKGFHAGKSRGTNGITMQSTGVADDAFFMIRTLSPATRLLQSLSALMSNQQMNAKVFR
jgi:hypothetical protein